MKINNDLRGLVYSKYPSMAEMAKSMGWSRQRLYKALSNPEEQSLKNIQTIMKALDLVCDNNAIRFFMPNLTI